MKIINLRGEVIAGGDQMDKIKFVRMRSGVQNLDGSHMAPRRTYPVPDWFALQLVGGQRADESTQEAYDAQAPEDQDADAPKLNIQPAAAQITNGDPAIENGDPKAKKK